MNIDKRKNMFSILVKFFVIVVMLFTLTSCNGKTRQRGKTIKGISFNDKTFVYDGLNKSIYIEGALPENIIVSYLNNGKVDAGNHIVIAQFTDLNDTSKEYQELKAILTIEPKEIEISFDDGEFTYDGKEKEVKISGNLPNGVTVEYINNKQINAGVYEVEAKFSNNNPNYKRLKDLTATLIIHKAKYDVEFNDELYIYDGEEKEVKISGNLPNGVTVEYINNKQINAGVYEVEAKFNNNNPNYKPLEDLTAILTIKPQEIKVSFDDKTFTYDGEEKEVKISGDLPDGVTVEYINNNQINAGVYEVEAKFKDSNNLSENFKELKAVLIIKLPSPIINETVEELNNTRKITWQPVEGAISYKIVIDGEEVTLNKNTLEYDIRNYVGYKILIYAVGDNVHINSEIKQLSLMITENDKNYIFFGKYPQTVVDDEVLIIKLNNKATQTNEDGYYVYRGNEYAKLSANPYGSNYIFSNGQTIVSGKTYYFKVEPIKWLVLEQADGTLTLLTDMILDKQQFYTSWDDRTIDGKTIYANNYEHSVIREWLNNDFYNKAFNNINKEIILTSFVDNSASTTEKSPNQYACDDTYDKVYLLSYQEAQKIYFNSNAKRQAVASDYARARYVYVAGNNYSYWWLRSPYYYSSYYYSSHYANRVTYDGCIYDYNSVYSTYYGARPALKIKID